MFLIISDFKIKDKNAEQTMIQAEERVLHVGHPVPTGFTSGLDPSNIRTLPLISKILPTLKQFRSLSLLGSVGSQIKRKRTVAFFTSRLVPSADTHDFTCGSKTRLYLLFIFTITYYYLTRFVIVIRMEEYDAFFSFFYLGCFVLFHKWYCLQ